MVGQRPVLSANLVTGVSAGSLCGQWKRDRPLPQSQGHLSCDLRLGTVPGPHSNAREHVSDMQKMIWKSWRSMTSHCRIFEEVMADLAPAITESVHYRSLAADQSQPVWKSGITPKEAAKGLLVSFSDYRVTASLLRALRCPVEVLYSDTESGRYGQLSWYIVSGAISILP